MNFRRYSFLALCLFPFAGASLLPSAALGNEAYQCPLKDKKYQMVYALSQGKDGWFFRNTTDFKQDFGLSSETAHYLSRLTEAFKAKGTTMVMIPLPVRAMVAHDYLDKTDSLQHSFDQTIAMDSFTGYIADLRKTGLQVINVEDSKEGVDSGFFFKRDVHWTPLGSQLAAEKAGALVKALPEYKKLTPGTYETEKTGSIQITGKIFMDLVRFCTTKIPAERLPVYETRLKATGADALFSSSGIPSVLIGTSFSEMDILNFEGFLSQYTGLTIANYAIPAGELFVSMVSYTSSPNLAENAPPFLFWETPGHYNINVDSAKFLRQIIPAVRGECSEKEALAINHFKVVGGAGGELLKIPEKLNVSGSDYYLFIKTENKAFTKFSLEMEYDDGDGEWFTINRSSPYINHGRYFIELWDDIPSKLTSVQLKDANKADATLEVRLCHSKPAA